MFLMTILRVFLVLTYRRLQKIRVKFLGYWCYSSCIDSFFWCNSYWFLLLFLIISSTNWCPYSLQKGRVFVWKVLVWRDRLCSCHAIHPPWQFCNSPGFQTLIRLRWFIHSVCGIWISETLLPACICGIGESTWMGLPHEVINSAVWEFPHCLRVVPSEATAYCPYSCGQLQMEQLFICNCSRERIIRLILDFFCWIGSRDFMRGRDLVCGIWIANPNRQPHSSWGLTESALFLRTRVIWLILMVNGAVCEGFNIVRVVPMKGTNYCLLVSFESCLGLQRLNLVVVFHSFCGIWILNTLFLWTELILVNPCGE
jgi:hypothetical protein